MLNLSLGRRSLYAVSTDGNLPVNDDAAEIEERKRRLEVRKTETLVGSPSRKSQTKDISLSAPDVFAHYTNCLKLSAENKINQKNAFHLQLIDFMSSMLKKNDERMGNFQVASCALDASTKIYAARVDRVHSDGVKMAGSLCMLSKSKNTRKKADKADQECTVTAGEGTKKIRRKCKDRKVITDNPNSLNAPMVQNYKLHPSFMYMKKKFSDCRPGSSNLVPRMEVSDDLCKLKFLHTESVFSQTKKMKSVYKTCPSIKGLKGMCITSYSCEPADFLKSEFINADKGKISYMGLFPCPEASQHFNDIYTQANGEAGADCNGIVSDEGEIDEEQQSSIRVVGCKSQRERENIVDITKHLSVKPLEYSYFNLEELQLWAGPSHWKLPKKRGTFVSKMRSKRVKKKVILESIFDRLPSDIDKILEQGSKLTLKRKTIHDKWASYKVTKELDIHYDTTNFERLYFQRSMKIYRKQIMNSNAVASQDEHTKLDDNNCGTNIQVDNSKDLPDILTQDNAGSEVDERCINGESDDGNWKLLSPPPKVARIEVPFAKTAKKIDMKKLKKIVWEILKRSPDVKAKDSSSSKSSGSSSESGREEDEMKLPMLASEMYKQLMVNVTDDIIKDMTFPIAFNCLLHLANDKRLSLTGKGDLSDVLIVQLKDAV